MSDTAATRGFVHLGDDEVHRGYIWTVVRASYRGPDGGEFQRDVVRSPGAVGAVPVWPGDDGTVMVTLVDQYRPPFGEYVLEIPAGIRDVADEPTVDTARRELVEEVGLAASTMRELTQFKPTAGMTDSVLHLFVATDLQRVANELHGPEEQAMDVVEMPLDDAVAEVMAGRITDAKTVIGLLMVDRLIRAGELTV